MVSSGLAPSNSKVRSAAITSYADLHPFKAFVRRAAACCLELAVNFDLPMLVVASGTRPTCFASRAFLESLLKKPLRDLDLAQVKRRRAMQVRSIRLTLRVHPYIAPPSSRAGN